MARRMVKALSAQELAAAHGLAVSLQGEIEKLKPQLDRNRDLLRARQALVEASVTGEGFDEAVATAKKLAGS